VLITNHVLAGAVVGRVVGRPGAAFAVGVASHFAMDSVPHWGDDSIFLRVAVVDGLVGLTTMAMVARLTDAEHRPAVVAGMLGACLPDADKPGELFVGRSPFPVAMDRWHKAIQREDAWRLPQEFLVAGAQALVLRLLAGRSPARG
jgi:hypothetical protein